MTLAEYMLQALPAPVACILLFCASKAHDIVTSVDKHYFACDSAGERAAEEERGVTNLALFNITAQRSYHVHLFAELGQTGDTASCEGIEWTSRNSVDSDVVLSQFVGQETHAALQGGFSDGHNVILWHYALAGHVGHG